jgi:hypothetical protein
MGGGGGIGARRRARRGMGVGVGVWRRRGRGTTRQLAPGGLISPVGSGGGDEANITCGVACYQDVGCTIYICRA